jgi:hypothetical protein
VDLRHCKNLNQGLLRPLSAAALQPAWGQDRPPAEEKRHDPDAGRQLLLLAERAGDTDTALKHQNDNDRRYDQNRGSGGD